jgi:hypothetical protein
MVTKTLSLVLVSTLTTAWRTCRSMKRTVSHQGTQELQAGARDAVEFAEALDHAGGVGAHGVHGFEDRDEHEDADDGGNDENENDNSGIVHDEPFLLRRWRAPARDGSGAGCGRLDLDLARVFEMQE